MSNCKAHIEDTAVVKNCDIADTAKVWKNVFLQNCKLYDNVNIGDFTRSENSVFKNNVSIQRNGMIYSSQMGRYSYCGKNFTMWHANVGSFCSISWNVSIGGANHDYRRLTTHSFLYAPEFGFLDEPNTDYNRFDEPCNIGNDVWIAANACICRGVTVGDGAVVAAGAVVTKDVPPYAIVAGVPAKVIKYRFNEDIIKDLLEIKWWNFPDEVIRENFKLFNEQPDETTIKELKRLIK